MMVNLTFQHTFGLIIGWMLIWLPCLARANCVINNYDTDETKDVGDEHTLGCAACTTEKNRNVSFSWSHDGVNILSEDGCTPPNWPFCGNGHRYCRSKVRLSEIDVSHRGTYICTAKCDDQQTATKPYDIQVRGPPHFIESPLARNISYGDDVNFSCVVESHPAAEVVWWTSGEVIANSTLTLTEDRVTYTSTAKLEGVTKHGQVFCHASNEFGSVNSTVANINIKEVPDPVIVTVDEKTVTSTSMMIRWDRGFDGYAPITKAFIKWVSFGNDTTNIRSTRDLTSVQNLTTSTSSFRGNASLQNLTTSTSSFRGNASQQNLTTDVYMITNLYPATLYDVQVAVSNDQGMSNWSQAIYVKTKYKAPPPPDNVNAHCFHDKINISWSSVPEGREYGQVTGFVIYLLHVEDTHSEVRKMIRTMEHHSLFHIKPDNTSYKISVHSISQGGQGRPKNIIYHCDPESVKEDQDNSDLSTETSSSLGTNHMFNESRDWATETPTEFAITTNASSLIQQEMMPAAASNTNSKPRGSVPLDIVYIPVLVVAAMVLIVIFMSLVYLYLRKNKEKDIQLNIPTIRAYVEETETTNDELGLLSRDRTNPSHRVYPNPVNSYQTHIDKLTDDYDFTLGASNAKSGLLRLPSQEGDYENCLTEFARRMNLDALSKQKFYEVLIPFHLVTLGKTVGEGEFGEVSIGFINEGTENEVKVAIKMIKDVTDRKCYETFIKEGLITTAFDHKNVLTILGISLAMDVYQSHVPLVIMPFMENGDLRTYLYNARVSEKVQMALYQLVGFMLDITAGMEYLANNKFVHRDLAARNCMLDSDLTAKIADFGLTRSVVDADYYRICQNGKCKIPVKWVAIESLRDGKFTTSSDVWAYGVTLWEIITQSQIPYPGIGNGDIYEHLHQGHRLRQPAGCPDNLYQLMLSCWEANEENRPSFTILKDKLQHLSQDWKEGMKVDMTSVTQEWKEGMRVDLPPVTGRFETCV